MTQPIELTTATYAELLAEQDAAAQDTAAAKGRTLRLTQELQRRLGESGKAALLQADKTHGTTSLQMQDGMVAKVEVKQTVKWDSAALQELAQTLPWERVNAMFSIKFSMSETIYKGIAAFSPEMRAKIDAARTTTLGEPSIVLSRSN